MGTVSIYLNFDGATEEAFKFYKSVFGGEFSTFQRYKEVPGMEKLSAEDGEKVMHVSMPLGDNLILMASDALAAMGHTVVMGNNFSINVEPGSKADADKLFSRLSEGGSVRMPLQDTFWGAYYGDCTDKFGVQWMVNYTYPR